MKTQNDITQEKETTPIQRVQLESSNGGTAQLADNRESTTIQRKLQDSMSVSTENTTNPIQRKANKTGLPDNLKSGIENLSGYSMDDVRVHYNSSKPAQLQAHAYAQGTDIHVAPGQEKHLPHEAWHVVQQKQGRVQPMMQFKSKVAINNDFVLEREADVMGNRALQTKVDFYNKTTQLQTVDVNNNGTIQRFFNVLAYTALIGLLIVIGSIIHDLYQRYKRYIQPADRTAEHLLAGGIHGQTENAALNVEQALDTLEQAHGIRNERQDDTRESLTILGKKLSAFLREGHTDIDELIVRAIQREFPGRDDITEEEFEFALQKAIMGSTRTRGFITAAARTVGGAIDFIRRQFGYEDQ